MPAAIGTVVDRHSLGMNRADFAVGTEVGFCPALCCYARRFARAVD